MFTGIIEAVGVIQKKELMDNDYRFVIDFSDLNMNQVVLGESIAVNGVCLTVIDFDDRYFSVDVSAETISCTGFAGLEEGSEVNLERAMQLHDRINGHLVSGHVDAVAKVRTVTEDGRSWRYDIEMPSDLAPFICAKGSITVDGTSLTVNHINDETFSVNIIPHTLEKTIIKHYQKDTRVNLEIDMIARYLQRLQETQLTEEEKT